MAAMALTSEFVTAASNAWVWVPDNAILVEDEQYKFARLPDYSEYQLKVLEFWPSGPLGDAVGALRADVSRGHSRVPRRRLTALLAVISRGGAGRVSRGRSG